MAAPLLCRRDVAPRRGSRIILCGQAIEIDWPVVTFQDDPRFDARRHEVPPTQPASGNPNQRYRYWLRPGLGERPERAQLEKLVRQFVVHYDGLISASDCFHVLQDERGLSAHFLIDNDGTIYQTLDLGLMAYHAKGVNSLSIGAELCNRGRVRPEERGYYQRHAMCRDQREAVVHGQRFLMWDFTEAQYRAMVALARALQRLLPGLPAAFPASSGDLIRGCIADVARFSGYLGHYHVTRNKPDPGCFDFVRLCRELRQRARWFFCPQQIEPALCPQEVAPSSSAAEQQIRSVLDADGAEPDAAPETYPLAPDRALGPRWSAGADLHLPAAAHVYSPLPGHVVAARQPTDEGAESAGFVLSRHTVHLAGREESFFLLLLHAAPTSERAPWVRRLSPDLAAALKEGQAVCPNAPIEAGEVLGGLSGPRLHVQVLARSEITAAAAPGRFRLVDASGSGIYTEEPRALPQPRRSLAVRYRSEFGLSDDYMQLLRRGAEFSRLSRNQQRLRYRDAVQPLLFWTPELSEKAGLPSDFIVWHYHPLEFLPWLAEQLGATTESAVRREDGTDSGLRIGELDDVHDGDDFLVEEDLPELPDPKSAARRRSESGGQDPWAGTRLDLASTAACLITAGAAGLLFGIIRRRQQLAQKAAGRAPTAAPHRGAGDSRREPCLVPLQGTVRQQVPITGQLLIGSGASAASSLVVADAAVSRQHCRITATPRGLVLEDLGSRNGTFVNGQRLTAAHLLRDGDVIALGNLTRLRFKGRG